MAGGCSVIDQRMSVFGFQESGDIRRADFHFQRHRDAVHGLHALAFEVLTMLMEIDKTGCYDQVRCVDRTLARQLLVRYTLDLTAGNADIADSIQSSFGIEHTTALDDQVVLLGEQRSGE